MIAIEFKCVSGSARVYSTRNADPQVLNANDVVTMPVSDVQLPEIGTLELTEEQRQDILEKIKRSFVSAWNSPAIGANGRKSGQVMAIPRGCGMVIREYVEVNAFLDPDAKDHQDHVVADGEAITANTITSNVVTLMPTRPI